jgi:hypothetical protein
MEPSKEQPKPDISDISDKVVIATTTFYNPDSEIDRHRAGNARNTVRNATEAGYTIVVVDGGSSDEFLREIECLGAQLHMEAGSGMGQSRRQTLQAAYDTGKPVVAWTEPEKESYIPEIYKTAVPILEGCVDLVVPRRNNMYSYPTAQQNAEPLGNSFWKALTGHDLDMWFGPRTWARDMSHYFLDYDGTEHGDKWDSIFIPVMDAIIDGKQVTGVEVNYTHPQVQTDMEDKSVKFYFKRLEQLDNLMRALDTHWNRRHPSAE